MSEHLQFVVEEGVATITLNRPDKLNAYTDAMLSEWLDALEACRSSPQIRVVVITGTGRGFTTGGDVGTFADKAADSPAAIESRLVAGPQRLIRTIAELEKPVIAALNGIATGGGLDVALACDIRFAAESARFAQTYARMGLIPGMGGAWLLPRIVGTAKALELFWTCDWVEAREAARIGLVSAVFPDEQLREATLAFAQRIARAAPLSVQGIKRVMKAGQGLDLNAALEIVAKNMPAVRASEDHKEALAAFKEKRLPNFKGR